MARSVRPTRPRRTRYEEVGTAAPATPVSTCPSRSARGRSSARTARSRRSATSSCTPSTSASPTSATPTATVRRIGPPRRTSARCSPRASLPTATNSSCRRRRATRNSARFRMRPARFSRYRAGTIGVPLPGPGAGGTRAPAGVLVLGADALGGGASTCNGSAGGGAAGPPRVPGTGLSSPHPGAVAEPWVSPQAAPGPAGTIGSAEAVAAAMISATGTPSGAIHRRRRISITAISGHRRRRPNCRR